MNFLMGLRNACARRKTLEIFNNVSIHEENDPPLGPGR